MNAASGLLKRDAAQDAIVFSKSKPSNSPFVTLLQTHRAASARPSSGYLCAKSYGACRRLEL